MRTKDIHRKSGNRFGNHFYMKVRYGLCPPWRKNFDECKQFATEIDHINPVSSEHDEHFYDTNNLQGLCKSCHSKKTARENGGFGNKKI